MKKLLFSFVVGTAVVFSACNDDEVTPASDYATPDFNVSTESVVTTDAAMEDAVESVDYEVDLYSGTSESISDLSTESKVDDNLKSGARERYQDRYHMGEAPSVSVEWEEGDFPRTITLDYGDETELENGRIISGTIKIVVSAPMYTEGATRTVTFTDFSVDTLQISGTIVKEIVSTDNERVAHIVRDLLITLPDGTNVEYYAELERTWTQGMGTPLYFGDDEMAITGYAVCSDSDGNQYRREITSALKKEGGCRYIVSGEVTYSYDGLIFGTVNYGDGSCDNTGQISTVNGQTEFIIGKRIRERIANKVQN